MITQLRQDLQFDRYEWIVIGAMIFMVAVCIGLYLYGHYGPHQEAIGQTYWNMIEDWPVNPNQDWTQLDPRWLA